MPRPDVSEERRGQILDAAMQVFARLGFHSARMDDIATEAGLSKGALYLYYKSKDAIIAAILRFFFASAMKSLRTLQQSEGPVRAQILSYAQVLARESEAMARLSPIAYEFYAVAGRQKSVLQLLREYLAEFCDALATLIQRGIDQGEFRPVDPRETAYTLCALVEGLNLLLLVEPRYENWRHQAFASVELILDGIANRWVLIGHFAMYDISACGMLSCIGREDEPASAFLSLCVRRLAEGDRNGIYATSRQRCDVHRRRPAHRRTAWIDARDQRSGRAGSACRLGPEHRATRRRGRDSGHAARDTARRPARPHDQSAHRRFACRA